MPRPKIHVSESDIRKWMMANVPIDFAATQLNCSRSTLKKRVRELGYKAWPFRKHSQVNEESPSDKDSATVSTMENQSSICGHFQHFPSDGSFLHSTSHRVPMPPTQPPSPFPRAPQVTPFMLPQFLSFELPVPSLQCSHFESLMEASMRERYLNFVIKHSEASD
ncbi:hypothetical protein P9112_000764 [Eukaryota sp. TZLM1-RC]